MKCLHELYQSYFHGKYDFSDFLYLNVSDEVEVAYEKNDKKVYRCSAKLKAIHRFINLFLFSKLKIKDDVVFSYRPGKNVVDAIRPHANNNYFFTTDIENFFPSINEIVVRDTINSNIDNFDVSDIANHIDKIISLTVIDNMLPIGFSTSPSISNACLYDLDNDISSFCKKYNFIYTRYADDLIFSSISKFDVADIKQNIVSILSTQKNTKFSLNHKKTRVSSRSNKIKLMGVVILPNGKVTVDINVKNKVETMLYFYLNDKDKLVDYSGMDYESTLGFISGLLNHINTIDDSYLDKLRMKYGNAIVDMFFHKSVK
ncbi:MULTISPECIES: reverse transcriptase domain-containing protein [Aeromonas]|uniref:reverse transcriptase domain-containing protein n=1 Tax=Aeromonas TaxID=642 RepID=UPI000F9A2DEE|nr:reverse transcriptase domain-containing protein [Aeromonas hydrophila]